MYYRPDVHYHPGDRYPLDAGFCRGC
ncbi:hypothetical protein YPPY36_3877, partial [Yersinia pestis PY-36]